MLYGPKTKLAIENFPISGQRLPAELIHALGHVKLVAVKSTRIWGVFHNLAHICLTDQQVEALQQPVGKFWKANSTTNSRSTCTRPDRGPRVT